MNDSIKVRKDALGNVIDKQKKGYKVTFIDRKSPDEITGRPLVEYIKIDSYKSYNVLDEKYMASLIKYRKRMEKQEDYKDDFVASSGNNCLIY